MATQVYDRVLETSTSTGTGNFTLLGAVQDYQGFAAVLTSGQLTYYCIDDQIQNWEIGIGTWTAGDTLARTTVLDSSNANGLVNFGPGTKKVGIVLPADILNYIAAGNFPAITATTATLGTVTATSASMGTLAVTGTATIGTLTGTTATIGTVNATTANLGTITATTGTIGTLTGTTATIGTVNATTANVTGTATIGTLTTGLIAASYMSAPTMSTTNLTVTNAPTFVSALPVSSGGTGNKQFTNTNCVLTSGNPSTGQFQTITNGSVGQVLTAAMSLTPVWTTNPAGLLGPSTYSYTTSGTVIVVQAFSNTYYKKVLAYVSGGRGLATITIPTPFTTAMSSVILTTNTTGGTTVLSYPTPSTVLMSCASVTNEMLAWEGY